MRSDVVNPLDMLKDDHRVAMAALAVSLAEPPDDELTVICEEFSKEHGVPIVAVNLALRRGVNAVASVGISRLLRRAPHAWSPCAYVAAIAEPFESSAPEDEKVFSSCLGAKKVRWYAGVPIYFKHEVVGAFSAADRHRRRDGVEIKRALEERVKVVEALFAERRRELGHTGI